MTLHPFVVGCDITRRIANTTDAVAAWINGLADTTRLIVTEATGRYDATPEPGAGQAGIVYLPKLGRCKRSVGGARTRLRQAFCMAALAAAGSDTALGRFHRRLRTGGKPPKAVGQLTLTTELPASARDLALAE